MHNELAESLTALLDAEDYSRARSMIDQALLDSEYYEENERLRTQVELYGFLCDLGIEGGFEVDLERSIAFMENNVEALESLVERGSYYYTLANAKSGLAKIQLRKMRSVPSPYATHEALHESISLYWMAFASSSRLDLKEQIAINLSSTLACAGRLIESIQFLDAVLRNSPSYPQALVSRAEVLFTLPLSTSGELSASLLTQVYHNCREALATNKVIPSVHARMSLLMEQVLSKLRSYGFDLPDLETEIAETQAEYQGHSDQRRQSIDNFLVLNEHAVYCPCNSAKWDDLQIGLPHLVLKGRIVPYLELLLNRLKAEFAWARSMYQSALEESAHWSMDAKYTELFEGESITPATEMLRSSFRQCYGILDKLAIGICELYGITIKNIYFEHFWEKREVKDALRDKKNIHLNALHSIACDLNTRIGQLKHFKQWRNALEHRLLVVVDGRTATFDPLGLLGHGSVDTVELEHFQASTLHLLQLTKAAIMSFTYCVRLETMTSDDIDKRRSLLIDFRRQ